MSNNGQADSLRQELEELMNEDEFEEALQQLQDFLNKIGSPLRDAVGQQMARYNRLRKEEANNTINRPDADVTRASIRKAILDIYDLAMKSSQPATQPGLGDVKVPEEVRLEAIIGTNNLLSIAWLEQGLRAAMSVCRIVTPYQMGTGFLIGPDLIMTNSHVIPSVQVAKRSKAEFNDPPVLDAAVRSVQRYWLDTKRFRASPVNALDYAIVGVLPDPKGQPLEHWGTLRLNPEASPVPSEHVVIIQHPGGGPKQIALTANQVVETVDYRLHYTTDTMRGSSGAPVFDQHWEVVALHHGAVEKPQANARGDKRFINEGILLSAIKADAGNLWPA